MSGSGTIQPVMRSSSPIHRQPDSSSEAVNYDCASSTCGCRDSVAVACLCSQTHDNVSRFSYASDV